MAGSPERWSSRLAPLRFGAVVALLVGVVAGGPRLWPAPAEGVAGGDLRSLVGVAAAEGVRFSVSAPGLAAVETEWDSSGRVAQAFIDGLGNPWAFASLPYPEDLAVTGHGLVAGLTALPTPPPYPFSVDSSYPTEEAKFTQPAFDLVAKSAEQISEATVSTGAGSNESRPFLTRTHTLRSRDVAAGSMAAEASGTADLVSIVEVRLAWGS